MKKYLLLLLVSCLPALCGEFVVAEKSGNPVIENVLNDNLHSEILPVGKTYTVAQNNYIINTSTNENVDIKFSNETFIKIDELSSLSINSFEQAQILTNKYPEKLSGENAQLSVSLISGQVHVYAEPTNGFTLSTTHVTVIPKNCKFVVRAERTSTLISCIEGSVYVMDNLNKKKVHVLEKNSTILIVSQPSIAGGKTGQLLKRQNIFTPTEMEESALSKNAQVSQNITTQHRSILFVVVNGKVYGIKK